MPADFPAKCASPALPLDLDRISRSLWRMIHNVFFWLKPDLSADAITRFEAGLLALGDIGAVQSCSVGRPALTPERPVTDKSFSYHLGLTFASIDDHNVYQDHPDHHVFVDGCRDLWERVVVYDSDPID